MTVTSFLFFLMVLQNEKPGDRGKGSEDEKGMGRRGANLMPEKGVKSLISLISIVCRV